MPCSSHALSHLTKKVKLPVESLTPRVMVSPSPVKPVSLIRTNVQSHHSFHAARRL
jgi:hypothetical protein